MFIRALAIAFILNCLTVSSNAGVVADVKTLPDLRNVTLEDVVVSCQFQDFVYVQDSSGAGIRITGISGFEPGTRLTIAGTVLTDVSGERHVRPDSWQTTGQTTPPAPFGMACRDVGGTDQMPGAGQYGVIGGRGPNNVGRYVCIWGKITAGEKISDGTREIRIDLPQGVDCPDIGSYVIIRGISSLIKIGKDRYPIALAPSAGAIQVLAPPGSQPLYGGEMVYVSSGAFLMGSSDSDPLGFPSERPQHEVYLDGYWIAKHEVTRGEYRKFIDAGGYDDPKYWSEEGWHYRNKYSLSHPAWWEDTTIFGSYIFTQTDSHPVVGVSWYEAEAYCNWAGVRMPTEAEWEKAARWNPALSKSFNYPWGDVWENNKCNWWLDSKFMNRQTAPVGSYPDGASYYGCMDMAGNVWEWVQDWMDPTYFRQTPSGGWTNPQGPRSSPMGTKVLKGGSWFAHYRGIYYRSGARCSTRGENLARWNEFPNQEGGKQGFRVAR
ncbi:MAG: formylglycine-generating enzyme family protein [Armatimonadetes bacterium]|nr:formylglycine-generating enzyme family protein [Armatimonadota bacterium]